MKLPGWQGGDENDEYSFYFFLVFFIINKKCFFTFNLVPMIDTSAVNKKF